MLILPQIVIVDSMIIFFSQMSLFYAWFVEFVVGNFKSYLHLSSLISTEMVWEDQDLFVLNGHYSLHN